MFVYYYLKITNLRGEIFMKEGSLIVVRKSYVGEEVIDNVINYMYSSLFVVPDETMCSNLDCDTDVDSIINQFYALQDNYNMTKKKRVFHFIISARESNSMFDIVDKGASIVQYFCEINGFQACIVPHGGSKDNYMNYHYHVVINPVMINGVMWQGTDVDLAKLMIEYLENIMRMSWKLRYSNRNSQKCSNKIYS